MAPHSLREALLGLVPTTALSLFTTLITLYFLYDLTSRLHALYLHPLAAYPGPKLRAVSTLPRTLTMMRGADHLVLPALHARYGPVVRVGPNELSYATGARAFRDIYGPGRGGRPPPRRDPLFYASAPGRLDLITADTDEDHDRQRKILNPSFSDRALKEQEGLLKKWAAALAGKMAEVGEGGRKFDLLKMYNCTTFDVMAELTFSEPLYMLEGSDYSPWVKNIFDNIKAFTILQAVKSFHPLGAFLVEQVLLKSAVVTAAAEKHHAFSNERVDRRLTSEPSKPDLWTRILAKDAKPGAGFSLPEHYGNAGLFLVAGTETTAGALAGTTYHLLRNPSTLHRLRIELRSAFPTSDAVDLDALARCRVLNAVLQEGLRMYPPVPIGLPRVVPAGGAEICGQYVPAGTRVAAHNFATFRAEELFKDAGAFHPERWLGEEGFEGDQLDAFEPFSVGPRNCLGKGLAWHEMRMLLATTVLTFELELSEESDNWQGDQMVYSLWEKVPLMCRVKEVKA